MSQWLYAGLKEAGFAVELLETRHVRDAFKAMPVKTDRNDARGIAQLMRLGWFRPVHCKSKSAQETRALLAARKLVQGKLYDIEMSLRGILRGFGLKVGRTTKAGFASRIMELTEHHPALKAIAKALLAVHQVLLRELNGFEKQLCKLARSDSRSQQPPAKLVVWWGTARSGLKGLCYLCDGTMGSAQIDPFGDPEAPGS